MCVVKLKSHATATQIENHKFSKFRESDQELSSRLADFGLFKGLGAWVNLLKNENLWRKSFQKMLD